MKESKAIKLLSYLFIIILPILIVGNLVYLFLLYENEEVLEADDVYSTETFKNLYINNLYNSVYYIDNIAYTETLENGYTKYVSYKYSNELLDCLILDNTNKIIFMNLDIFAENSINKNITEDTFLSGDYIKEINNFFIAQENKYFIYDNGSINTNMESLRYINNNDVEIFSYLRDNYYKYTNPENSDIIIYSKISEEKKFDFYLFSLFFDLTQYLGRSPLVITPILFILFISSIIYVTVAAGHKRNYEGIYTNTFDEIPLDFITALYFIILMILYHLVYIVCQNALNSETAFYTTIMICSMVYVIASLLIVSWYITIVRRLKGKVFIKNNIITFFITTIWKGIKWTLKKIWKILSRICNALKAFNKNLYKHIGLNIRILVLVFGFALLTTLFFCLSIDSEFFIFILFGLWGITTYYIVKRIARFKEIKNALESIYNGEININLNENIYFGELKDMSHYINDISGGFANAIEQGIKSERMKAELITNVSHDIKTPLTSIISYVDLLKKEDIKNEKAKEYLEILDSKSQRLKRLTEDLVEASKASSGNLKLTMTKLNLEELLSQSIGEFKDKFDEKKLDIVYNIKKEKINKVDRINQIENIENLDKIGKISSINKIENLFIKADSRYMFRIIENLFSNIYKYALENSRVYIELLSKDDEAIICIKNISRDKLNISEEELMQRFVRGDKSRTTEGSGLGISIAKSLTELQNGKFELSIDGDLFKVILKFKIRDRL